MTIEHPPTLPSNHPIGQVEHRSVHQSEGKQCFHHVVE